METGPAVSLELTRMQFPSAPVAVFGPLSLKVAPGEVVALIGPSGVGKTTLLRMIGGLERGYEGQIRVGDVPADLAPPLGFVFQDARLLPWLDAAGNIRAVRPDIGQDEIAALLRKVGPGAEHILSPTIVRRDAAAAGTGPGHLGRVGAVVAGRALRLAGPGRRAGSAAAVSHHF